MSVDQIRTLLLPNQEHPYGNSLQESLERCGVTPLKCDAGWGFELHKNLELVFDLRPDILHLQWPESLCRADEAGDLDVLANQIGDALAEVREKGIPIVWTMHNLKPHIDSNPGFQTKMYEHFATNADGVIHHSNCGMREARQTYAYRGDAGHAILRHGYFAHGTECNLSQAEAREELRLPAKTLIYLFCGAFRMDKNIDILVQAFGDDSPDASYTLVMVGRDQEVAASLYPGLNMDRRNIVWPGRLPFEELSVYVRASDGLVSAHGDKHLTSAGPHLSQSYLKSQICLSTEYNKEVLGESAFYFEKGRDTVESLRNRLTNVTPEMLNRASATLEQQRREYHWDVIGRNTRTFYEDLLDAN